MTITGGPRKEHEAIAANAIRWRRIENGEPDAIYVLNTWRLRQKARAKKAEAARQKERCL